MRSIKNQARHNTMTLHISLADLDQLETWLINQYVTHPNLARFCIGCFLALLSLVQHIFDKLGYMSEFGNFLSNVSKLIILYFMKGGV